MSKTPASAEKELQNEQLNFKVILSLLLFWGFINSAVAQSDLEIVDNFKNEFTSIEEHY